MKDFTEMIKLGLSSIVYDWQKLDTKNVKARLFGVHTCNYKTKNGIQLFTDLIHLFLENNDTGT